MTKFIARFLFIKHYSLLINLLFTPKEEVRLEVVYLVELAFKILFLYWMVTFFKPAFLI